MAVGKKLLSVFFSFTLVMGLLPYSAFADPLDSSSDSTESSSDVSTSNGSEFADGGVASKPDPNDSEGGMDSNGSVSGGEDPEFGTDDEFADEQELSAPDYSDGKLAIWADGLDDPSDITDVYPPDTNEIEAYANGSSLQPMTFSSEMLYFCKYESSCNYDQGLSSGDGYHAMGYFQFDNRYGLGSFLKAVYNYNPSTYSALKVIGDRYEWDVTGATRSNGAFTQLGNDLNTAWHAAYKANPTEFSNLQNGWAYIDSYNGSLGARGCLKAFGINLDNRPDCIKGLCWGMVNLFGAGGGASYINNGNYYGANWFFKNSGINDSMSDEAFVTTLCDYVVNNVAKRYPKQSIYWTGWQNRYKSEKADCLKYLQASNYIAPSPKNVTAAASGSGEVTLSWDPVDGAQAYAVAEYVGGGYRTYTTSCASTSYTVGDLSNGKEHSFLVQARVGGRWSAVSADLHVSATPQGPTRPEPKAEPGNGTVKLTWDKVPGASAYAVATRNADGSYKTYTLSCTATSYTVAGLVNGRSYDFLVQAKVDGAWSPFSPSDLVSAAPFDPASPKNVTAAASGSGEVTLSWDPVDGAQAYAVAEYVGGGYRTYTTSCASTSYTVGDLSNGKEHSFLVQARVGGRWSAVSADLHVSATPQGPTRPEPKAEPGNGTVKLTWDKVPGASAYAVATRNADGSYKTYTLSCTATSYTVAGLVNGRSYDFLVQAKVDGAWSPFSPSDLVSAAPFDPASPKNVTAAASGSGEVTLSWDPVDGAQAYAVAEYVGGGYRTYTTSCASTSYTVGDLSNGKEHSFLVQARVGGRWSAVSADLHVSATPQGPTRPEPKAEPGNGTVKLTWDKVPGATKYAVTREGTTVASYTESCEFEARGLANGVSYGYRVRALIDGSWTPLTDSTVWATPSDPEAPKAVASLDAEGSVNLKWSAVDGADKYAIALKTNGGYSTYTYDCRRTEFSVKNLKPGNYQFLVQAHLPSGWSSFSANDLVSIRVPDPSSPMVAVGYSGSNSAVLSWDSVPGAAKYAIAEYKNGSFCNLSIDHKATSYEVKDLNLGEKHRYLVQAFVDGAWSKYSEDDLVEVIVPDEKSPKAKAEATGDGQVTLSWDLVPGADRYAIAEYIDGGYRTYTTSCKGQSYTVDNLGNGNEHKFLIQAQVNGKWSAASPDLLVAATPHGVMAPTVKAKAGDLSATLEWNSVPGATRYAIASQNRDGSFTTYTYNCGGTSFTVKGLIGGRTYKMLVQAYVDGKWSPFSSVDLVSVKPYGTNTPTGQQMMSDIANNSGFTSGTSYLILVSRSRHEVGVFRGSFNNWNCIKFWSCVTGAPSTPTITGEYRTTGFKRTNLSTDTRARWCTQINGGYFFHSILASNSELGNSQSHGCIRLAVENAKWIYDNIWQGTKVYIY